LRFFRGRLNLRFWFTFISLCFIFLIYHLSSNIFCLSLRNLIKFIFFILCCNSF
jgi:hypothetical protein